MSKETQNKAIVAEWFKRFWGNPYDEAVIGELGADDLTVFYPMHGPRKGKAEVKKFMVEFREAFPDLNFWDVEEMVAEGDIVVARWDGGGTNTGPAFDDLPVGALPRANTGKTMRFTGTSWLEVRDGKIVNEPGQECALAALQQLVLIPPIERTR